MAECQEIIINATYNARYETKRRNLVRLQKHFRNEGSPSAVRIAEKIIQYLDSFNYYWKRDMNYLTEKMNWINEAIAKGNLHLIPARKYLDIMYEKLSSIEENEQMLMGIGSDWESLVKAVGEGELGMHPVTTSEASGYGKESGDQENNNIESREFEHDILQKLTSMTLEEIEDNLRDAIELEEVRGKLEAGIEENIASEEQKLVKGKVGNNVKHTKTPANLRGVKEDYKRCSETQHFTTEPASGRGRTCERSAREECKGINETDRSCYNVAEECKAARKKT